MASASVGFFENFDRSQSISGARLRSNIQSASPSVHMFLQRSASLLPSPNGLTASNVWRLMSNAITCQRREAAIVERVCAVARLGKVPRVELAGIDDDEATGTQVADIGLECGRVHRDQHVGLVAGRLDAVRAEVDLERADAERRPLRRADLGGEVGKGREILAGERCDRVNWPPVSCIPSPLSPAKRTTIVSAGSWRG